MPKSPKIPKETILQAALRILIRDGFADVNIKTIARELSCSTQPVSWHFGNMKNLRTALGTYACEYADAKTSPTSGSGLNAFGQIGAALADIAFDEPNLYRFLFMDGGSGYCIGSMEALTELTDSKELIQVIASENDLPFSFAAQYMESMIIYTMGILSLCISGVLHYDKETVLRKIEQASNTFLARKIEK